MSTQCMLLVEQALSVLSCCSLKYPNFTPESWPDMTRGFRDAERRKHQGQALQKLLKSRDEEGRGRLHQGSVSWDRLAHIGFCKVEQKPSKSGFHVLCWTAMGVYFKNMYIYNIYSYLHVFKFLCFSGARTGRGFTGHYGIPWHFMSNCFSLILALITYHICMLVKQPLELQNDTRKLRNNSMYPTPYQSHHCLSSWSLLLFGHTQNAHTQSKKQHHFWSLRVFLWLRPPSAISGISFRGGSFNICGGLCSFLSARTVGNGSDDLRAWLILKWYSYVPLMWWWCWW